MENMLKLNNKQVNDMTDYEVVDDYCSLDYIRKTVDARAKTLRSEVEKVVKENAEEGEKTLKFSTEGALITLENRVRRDVAIENLRRICKDKNIQIGEVKKAITPKVGKIPADVIDILDQYFEIEEIWEAKAGDVDKALAANVIDSSEANKIIVEKPTIALKPSLTDRAKDQVML